MSNEKYLIEQLVATDNLPVNPNIEFENLVTDYIMRCGFSNEEAEQAAINTLETEVVLC